MRLLLIRHAEPAYPDDALTAEGHRQARALASRLARAGLDRVHSSPLERALETARYTVEQTGLRCEVETWTRELESWAIDQPPRGEAPAWEVDSQAVRAAVPAIHAENWHARPPLDQPILAAGFEELRRHSDGFLARYGLIRQGGLYRVERAETLRVAVFCHAGLALTWLAHLLEIPPPLVWAGFTLFPSSVTTLVFERDGEGRATPRCLSLGDLSHLAGDPPG
jgi:broad specificity phosphatase PhoE